MGLGCRTLTYNSISSPPRCDHTLSYIIMITLTIIQVIDHGRQAPTLEAYQVHVGSMRATSKGWLKLASNDPRKHPLIDPNYLSNEQDR